MRQILEAILSDSLSSVGFLALACPVSCFVCGLRTIGFIRRGTGQLYFEKSIVVPPNPCVVEATWVELFWGRKGLYHVAQLRLRPSLRRGVSQIMPVGWVVLQEGLQAPAGSGALFKAKPGHLTLEGWGDHTVSGMAKRRSDPLWSLFSPLLTHQWWRQGMSTNTHITPVCLNAIWQSEEVQQVETRAHHKHLENIM